MKKIYLMLVVMLCGVGVAQGKIQTPVTDFETRLPIADCRSVLSCATNTIRRCETAIGCPGGQVCYCQIMPTIEDDICIPVSVSYTQDLTYNNGCKRYKGSEIICGPSGKPKEIITYACSIGCYVNKTVLGGTPDCRQCPNIGESNTKLAVSGPGSIQIGTKETLVTFKGIESCYLLPNDVENETDTYQDADGEFVISADCMYGI